MKQTVDLNETYWANRYQTGKTGWDMGSVSPPLKAYFDQLKHKDLKILIPGAGNAYEAAYLWKSGFSNVHILDLAENPLSAFQKKEPNFPTAQIFHENFFRHVGSYDLIVEQTFFCALDPELRPKYVQKVAQLLKPSGKLIGLLWNKEMGTDQPPFGGSADEYRALFSTDFKLDTLENSYNSIPPRVGNEFFFKFLKK
ncbi:MAG: methyltransferase domain-containing protein [Bacteroidota bacterium]